jgi:hypothetical protein
MENCIDGEVKRRAIDEPTIADSDVCSGTSRSAVECCIDRRLAKKLGCKPDEVDLMPPSGHEEPVQ